MPLRAGDDQCNVYPDLIVEMKRLPVASRYRLIREQNEARVLSAYRALQGEAEGRGTTTGRVTVSLSHEQDDTNLRALLARLNSDPELLREYNEQVPAAVPAPRSGVRSNLKTHRALPCGMRPQDWTHPRSVSWTPARRRLACMSADVPDSHDLSPDDALQRRTYRVTEAARILGVGRNGVYELVRSGRLRALHLGAEGHRIVIPRDAIDELLAG
jgi:excisionase family DNA binding protein